MPPLCPIESVLDQSGKDAFLRWLQKGGNFLGVHAGCACLFTTDFYQKEVGALFDYHPTLQQAVSANEVEEYLGEDEEADLRPATRLLPSLLLLLPPDLPTSQHDSPSHEQHPREMDLRGGGLLLQI